MELLQQLLAIASPAGSEEIMRDFLIRYFNDNTDKFRQKPVLYYGRDFQNSLAVCFGKPRTAVFAHMDTVGYMARYDDTLAEIGSPLAASGTTLTGRDSQGEISCILLHKDEEEEPRYEFYRLIERGTELTYPPDFREKDGYIISPYLDNRAGIWNALKLAETLEDGLLLFSCMEEHRGGTTAALADWMVKAYDVRQALISDVTWVTEGVHHAWGPVISLRDRDIPRRTFVKHIMELANEAGLRYQVEVETEGSSDGGEIQRTPYFVDWCFVGAPYDHIHSPKETMYRKDLEETLELYKVLMERL